MGHIITVYQTATKKIPFDDWITDELDHQARHKIYLKINRLVVGNFCNCKSIGTGIYELKIDSGPGYRVYFSLVETNEILLLIGGTKRTQKRDIEKAKRFLEDFKKDREKHDKKCKI